MGWENFAAVRNNFVGWCEDLYATEMDIDTDSRWVDLLPAEIREWKDLPDEDLGRIFVDKLGPRLGMMGNDSGRRAVLGLMVTGAAVTSPAFCAFLIGIQADTELLSDFCLFLTTLTQLAKEALK